MGSRFRRAAGASLVACAVAAMSGCGAAPARAPVQLVRARLLVAPPVLDGAPDVPADQPTAEVPAVPDAPAAAVARRGHTAVVGRPARSQPAPDRPLFTVEIPRMGLVARAHEGQSADVLGRGPGHLPSSAMPGHAGNTVIPGHRTVGPHPFLDIDVLQPGDEIVLTDDEGRFAYEVTGTAVVSPEDGSVTLPTPDATLTLYACHPKGSDRERYVVFGRLLGTPLPAAPEQAPPPPPASPPAPAPEPAADRPKGPPSCGVVPCVHR